MDKVLTLDPTVGKPKSYRDLLVWQKGMLFGKVIYSTTATVPTNEKFGLVAQMRRAAVSIPSNMAEGQARHTRKEFAQFISRGEGSVAELETQLMLACGLGLCSPTSSSQAFELLD